MRKYIFLSCLILTMLCKIETMACTPRYEAPEIPKVPDVKIELSEKVKEAVNKAVKKQIEKMVLDKPEITNASYYKNKSKKEYSFVNIKWNDVEDVTSYKVTITKKDDTSKTYETRYNMLTKNASVDDFILDGMDDATVKVRAYGENETYSMWSEDREIEYNETECVQEWLRKNK